MASRDLDFVDRPFENLPGETDWVALREVVPAATATVRTTAEYGGREVQVATLLPGLWPAWYRSDGTVLVGLQTQFSSGDASRDIAQALLAALALDAPGAVDRIDTEVPGPRLQDVLDPAAPFEVTVHEDFSFWQVTDDPAEGEVPDPLAPIVKAARERADASVVPTRAVEGTPSAYWCRLGAREFLRWAMTVPEEQLIDGLARLQAVRASGVVEGAKYAGAFRACGIVIPVWELPTGTRAEDLVEPLGGYAERLSEAVGTDAPLSPTERRARAGLVARSVTLR